MRGELAFEDVWFAFEGERWIIRDLTCPPVSASWPRTSHGPSRVRASGRTSLVIAHRLSTIRGADRVVVLDAGQVVESGSPSELRAAGGRYARFETESERVV